jgi:transposase-like protein
LTSAVATFYLLGVLTRRMEKLIETSAITLLSKSQVSVMARELDEQVAASAPDRSTRARTHSRSVGAAGW